MRSAMGSSKIDNRAGNAAAPFLEKQLLRLTANISISISNDLLKCLFGGF